MQESFVKGDDAFVLLESPYDVSLLQVKLGKQGLHKWEKWLNLTRVQTSLLSFNLLCALEKNLSIDCLQAE